MSNVDQNSQTRATNNKTTIAGAVAAALATMSGSAWAGPCDLQENLQKCRDGYQSDVQFCEMVKGGTYHRCEHLRDICNWFWSAEACEADYQECIKPADEAFGRCESQAQYQKDYCEGGYYYDYRMDCSSG
jgi:hypothetical protein